MIQQHACAAAALAVDEADAVAGQIRHALQLQRVAGPQHEALFPVHQPDQQHGLVEQFGDGLPVVDAVCGEQVAARQMAAAAGQRLQAAQ